VLVVIAIFLVLPDRSNKVAGSLLSGEQPGEQSCCFRRVFYYGVSWYAERETFFRRCPLCSVSD